MNGKIIPTISGKGGDFQELSHHPLFGLFMISLRTVLGAEGVCHLTPYCSEYSEFHSLLEVKSSNILGLVNSSQFCHVLWLCHSLKDSALLHSLLFQQAYYWLKKKRMLTFLFFKLEESFVSKVVLIDQVKRKGMR